MIKIYYKNRFISITQSKLTFDSPDFQSIMMSEAGDLKIVINQFITNNNIQHLNIYGTNPQKAIKLFQSALKPIMAAGGCIYNPDNLWLFIYRNDKWDLPKGKAKKRETPEECALREVCEECSTDIEQLEIENHIRNTFHLYKHKDKIIIKEIFWYKMFYNGDKDLLKPQTEENIQECTWFDNDSIPQLMENSYASIADLIKDIFE